MSAVVTILAWPNISCTTFRSTPAASASDAAPWRKSCSRTGGSPHTQRSTQPTGGSSSPGAAADRCRQLTHSRVLPREQPPRAEDADRNRAWQAADALLGLTARLFIVD